MGTMNYQQVIRHFGTQVKTAAALGITQSTVSAWRGTVPARYQYQIEVITDGKLRADKALRAAQKVKAAHQDGCQ